MGVGHAGAGVGQHLVLGPGDDLVVGGRLEVRVHVRGVGRTGHAPLSVWRLRHAVDEGGAVEAGVGVTPLPADGEGVAVVHRLEGALRAAQRAVGDVERDVLVVAAVVGEDLRAALLRRIPHHAHPRAQLVVEGDAGLPVLPLHGERVVAKADVEGDLVHDAPAVLDEAADDGGLGRGEDPRRVLDGVGVGDLPRSGGSRRPSPRAPRGPVRPGRQRRRCRTRRGCTC